MIPVIAVANFADGNDCNDYADLSAQVAALQGRSASMNRFLSHRWFVAAVLLVFASFATSANLPAQQPFPQSEPGNESFVDATLQPPADYAPRGFQPRGFQDAPGVPEYSDYERESDPIPEYIYDPSYYDAYDAEIHQLADYAPPGYETRDYQSAPAIRNTPESLRLSA